MATRSKKPKCTGSTSQSCGMGCISRENTCRELIAANVATRLLSVAKQHQQPNDAAGQTFDSIAANFPPKLLAKAHKTSVATSDLGNGATLTTKVATGLDGSSIKYGFVTDADGARYTISDGLVKEVTSAAGSEWQEAFDAAVRSKVALSLAKAATGLTPTPTPTPTPVPASVANVIVPVAAGLSNARQALVKDFGQPDVDAAEATVKKIFTSKDTQVFIKVSSQDNLNKILNSGRMATSAELGIKTHKVPDLQDSDYQTARNRVEEKVLGVSLTTDAKDRPIYGYLGSVSSDSMTSKSHSDVQSYGGITIKLKDDAKTRTTFTGSDSFKSGHASSILNPNAASLVSDTKFGYDITDQSAPITGFAVGFAKSQRQGALATAIAAKNADDLAVLAPTGANYLEAQIHGGVKASDIEEINFTPKSIKDTPDNATISQALALGIDVKIHGVSYTASDFARDAGAVSPDAIAIEKDIRGGKNMADFGNAVFKLDKASKANNLYGASQDTQLYALQEARGFTRKPNVVTETGLTAKLKAGGSLAVRGLKGSNGLTASQAAEATRTGDHYIGFGIYGHGMYVGHSGTFYSTVTKAKKKTSANTASSSDNLQYVPSSESADIKRAYKGATDARYINSDSADLRMHIPSSAKIVTQDNVQAEMSKAAKAWDDFANDSANGISKSKKNAVANMAFGATDGRIDSGSISRFAVMSGYDAIALTKSYEPDNFMVILNHSMLSIADKNRDKSKGDY